MCWDGSSEPDGSLTSFWWRCWCWRGWSEKTNHSRLLWTIIKLLAGQMTMVLRTTMETGEGDNENVFLSWNGPLQEWYPMLFPPPFIFSLIWISFSSIPIETMSNWQLEQKVIAHHRYEQDGQIYQWSKQVLNAHCRSRLNIKSKSF